MPEQSETSHNVVVGVFHENGYPEVASIGTCIDTAFERFLALPPEDKANASIMSYERYVERERKAVLDDRPSRCTAAYWNQRLDVLPPLSPMHYQGSFVFFMRERLMATYTQMLARFDGTFEDKSADGLYAVKVVDLANRSTWITRDEMLALQGTPPTVSLDAF